MTIGKRILAGCLALTMLTALVGACGQAAEQRLGRVAVGIYDNAFMAMSYLRSAQVAFGQLASSRDEAAARRGAADLLGDLDVAIDRAMSAKAQAQARTLRGEVARALPLIGTDRAGSAAVEAHFEALVERFAGDGFRDRRQVGLLIKAQTQRTGMLLAGSLAVALLTTLVLARAIAPPIGRAIRVAQSIASGKLDNPIAVHGRGETADLLRALAWMQASIVAAMARIEALMQAQAASHADEIAAHNETMTAALENMNQGLCLFDGEGRLSVFNRRYGEMFGAPKEGAGASEVLRAAGLAQLVDVVGGAVEALSCELADGRTIAVSQQSIGGGGGWVATFEDVSERRATEARLFHVARHDELTALPNRLLFGEHLSALFARAADRQRAAMLLLDLDRFKTINDTLGHAMGDALLRAVADRLRACCGEEDVVARLGGDEFAIVQMGEQPHAAAMLAQRLGEAIAETFELAGCTVDVGLSVGAALAAGAPSADELLKCADLALHRAKADGRGCLRFFEPEMDLRARQRHALELEMRHALRNGEFEIFYQPQVSPAAALAGFEALLRWRHPTRGLISPAAFIPLAEDTGLIGPIGAWVLVEACRTAMTWPGEMKIAVNLSPAQFRTRQVGEDVRHALRASGLPPQRLELEITEALLMEEDDAILAALNDVRALGVRVAMDDFGTGYSSLAYLSRFPFDKIKIDQSFVREMGGNAGALSIIRAIIGLGHSLGMSVNAEGVETDEQRLRLTEEGCGELQGYLFGRPIPPSALEDFIGRFRSADVRLAAPALS